MVENGKNLNIYVASSWRNEFQPEVVRLLRLSGHTVYDFKAAGTGYGDPSTPGPGGFGWSEIDPKWKDWSSTPYLAALSHPRAVEGFNRDMNALRLCDVCIMVMPCGPSASMEMGWAAGAGKPTLVYVPAMREPELMVKMAHLVTNKWSSVMVYLSGLVTGYLP